ncbi:hypothetical protein [Phytoactinopolyspora mesophila]|nr:hypothetical protein [Phytoactinopolyspora mesophila]
MSAVTADVSTVDISARRPQRVPGGNEVATLRAEVDYHEARAQ